MGSLLCEDVSAMLSFRRDSLGLGKQCRPRSDCSSIVFTVCYSICLFLTKYTKVCFFVSMVGRLQLSLLASKNLGTFQ